MSEKKYTPSPWKLCYKDDDHSMCMSVIVPASSKMKVENDRRLCDDPNRMDVIAVVFHQLPPFAGMMIDDSGMDVDIEVSDANANLIAAAPELLEALEDMLSGWRYIRRNHGDLYGVGWDRAEEKAKAAIAKAKGEQA
jgi:hypothetical protein